MSLTRLFGIVGHPIGHSLSPAMHGAAFQALGVDALYAPFDVPPRFLSPMLRAFVLCGVEGLNVTVPLKESALPLMDRLDPSASVLGAVNTIVIRNRRMTGYNTDPFGLARALRELGWRPRAGRTVVILGAGGAARAAAWVLSAASGIHVIIANRHLARAQALVRWLKSRRPRVSAQAVPLAQVDLHRAALLVNATTVGMRATDRSPVAAEQLHRGLLVYDMIYHRKTALLAAALRRGCVAAGGRSMLLYQGAASLQLWLGRTPPMGAMGRALDQALRHAS